MKFCGSVSTHWHKINDMSVFAPGLSSLWQQIEDSGLDPAPLFLKHGIDKATIFDPNARVRNVQVDKIAAEANEQIQDPFFGAREAEYFRPAHLGPLGFAWLASTSLHEAIMRLQRYSRVIDDKLGIVLTETEDVIIATLEVCAPSPQDYHSETGNLAVLVRMCRFLCGQKWNPVRVTIAHPEPSDPSYFFSHFCCPVDFGEKTNSVHLDSKLADEPLHGANEYLAQLNDHIVVRYLAHRSLQDIVNRAKANILDTLGNGNVTEKAVAERLHMSPRQLNRRLKEEQTSFKIILVECRRQLAEQYISDSSLSLTEISYLLGFSEASSFSRAFRRWTGQSPTEARGSSD
jgi:AraC-like DNA-binding protein